MTIKQLNQLLNRMTEIQFMLESEYINKEYINDFKNELNNIKAKLGL